LVFIGFLEFNHIRDGFYKTLTFTLGKPVPLAAGASAGRLKKPQGHPPRSLVSPKKPQAKKRKVLSTSELVVAPIFQLSKVSVLGSKAL
jgi:hypothetical protein